MKGKPAPVDTLTFAQAKAEHAHLAKEIAKNDRLYYQEDAPKISDADYDALRQRYEALEASFPELVSAESLTQKVGAAPSEKFAKVRHKVPMLSLGNVFSEEEVEDFVARVRRFLGLKRTRRSNSPPSRRSTASHAPCATSTRSSSRRQRAATVLRARMSPPMC